MDFFTRKKKQEEKAAEPSHGDISGMELLRLGLGGSQELGPLLRSSLPLGIGAGDILALAREQSLKGGAVKAYSLLQAYLDLRPQETRAAEIAHELALLSLRELHRSDLAVQWARYGISMEPGGAWAGRLGSILNSLA